MSYSEKGFSSFASEEVGFAIGTRMSRFSHESGIEGLARISGTEIRILAVQAHNKRLGALREFVARMKDEFERVEFLELMNRELESALERYGFKLAGRLDERGRFQRTMVWRLKPLEATVV